MQSPVPMLVVCSACVLSAALAACGGRVSGDPPDSGAGSTLAMRGMPGTSAGDSGSNAVPFGTCPAEAPSAGDSCVTPDQGCVYLAAGTCQAFVCEDSGQWKSSSTGC